MLKNGVNLKKGIKALAVVFAIGYIFSFSQVQAATTIGANISTDGYLKLNTSAVPPSVDGTIHYDGTKFRCYENGAWKDCIGGISGTVLVNQGGTNITSYTAGDLLYATGATTLNKLAIGANGQILTSNGTAPTWTNTNPLVLTNTYVHDTLNGVNPCTSESNALVGDVCIATTDNKTYILQTSPYSVAGNWTELIASSGLYLQKSSNLSDLTSVSSARTNLGLGTTDTPTFSGLNLSNYLDITPSTPPAYSEGRLYYDNTLKSLSYYNDQSTVAVNIGQKNILRVENNSGGPISFGQVVYISGAGTGGIPAVALARADNAATSKVLGFSAENIANGSQGYITAYGMLTGLNTSVFTAGDPLFLSPTVAGGITATRPMQPNYEVPVGYIGKSGAADGTILAFVVPRLTTQVTPGGVPFGNAAGYLIDDSANLFWNDALDRLGIGTNTPAYTLDVRGDIKTGNGSLFYLGTNNGVPASTPANGAMYYDTGSNKFRCYIAGSWSDCDTTGGTTTLQSAYNNGATISTAGTNIGFTLNTTDQFTASGTGSINLTPTGASSFTSGAALTLTGGATSTWGTSAGDLNLAVNGAGTGNVQIGTGAGTTTPDFLVLDLKTDAEGALAGTNGAMYYNASTNKFRCYQNSAWVDCINVSGGTALSSLTAATATNSINNGDNDQTWNWLLTTAGKTGLKLTENTVSTGAGSTILEASTLATSTATPLRVINRGTAPSFIVENSPADTTPPLYITPADLTSSGHVAIGSNFFDPTNPEKLKVDSGTENSFNIISATGDLNNYLQINIQNRNNGNNASSDVVATADNGDESNFYIDMGINSSGYNQVAYNIGGPNDAYILAEGDSVTPANPGGNLLIGTGVAGKMIKFNTGGSTSANEKMRIEDSGNVGIATTTPGSELDVKGTLRLSGATSGYVGFSPAAAAGSQTYILPSADGSAGDAIVTNGSGTLSWAPAGSKWNLAGNTLSPVVAGNDITTSGSIYTSGSGAITSAGLLTGQLGLTVTGAPVSLNSGATAASNFNTSINEGTSTGTVTIGNSVAGAIGVTSGAALTLTGGATSTWGTSSGNLNFAVNGAGTGNVQIGSGTPSTTPDLLVLDNKTDAEGALAGTNGAMYYNASTNKFRCYVSGAWGDCASAALSSLTAATAANSINNGDNAQTWNWDLINNNKSGITFGENTASTGTGTSIVNVSNLTSSTVVPLVVNNIGAGDSFRVNDTSADTSPFLIDKDGNVAIGSTSFDPTNPEKLLVNSGTTSSYNVIKGTGQINGPLNLSMQNKDAGTNALSVVAAIADNGNSSSNALAMGIASSGFNDPINYGIAGPDTGFLVNLGSDLVVGTAMPSTNIKFITGAGFSTFGERMRLDSNGNLGIGTTSVNARLDLAPATSDALRIEPYGVAAGNTGGLEFMELAANGSNYVGFKSPDSIAANKVWTLPNADGTTGQVLTTDGSGVLSFTSGATNYWQRVATTLSPVTAGDAVTTTGNISTTSTGTITSAGLLTGNTGLTINGGAASINDNSAANNTSINTGTSTGTVTIGSANAGAIGVTSGAALTLAGGAASSFSTTGGDITLQPAGALATANVQIGAGQPGSGTPDLLQLDVKSTGGDPGTGVDGAMYYNESSNKFRCHINGSWGDCDTTGATATLQSAYNNGAAISTAGTNIALTLNTTDQFTASGAGSVNLTPTGASSFTTGSGNALTLTGGGASTWSTGAGALTITSAAGATWGTSAGDLTLQAHGGVSNSVKIGTGGSGTPNLFVVDVKNTTGDPAGSPDGAMYYNSALATPTFRCHVNGGWQDCGATAATATTLQQAYAAGNTITTSAADGDFTATGTEAVNLTPAKASQFVVSGGALTLTGGGTSTWSTSTGNLNLDAAAILNLGTTNSTAINIGRAGGGAISLTSPSAVNLTPYGAAAGNTTSQRFLELAANGTNYAGIKAPDALAGDYTLILPTTAGSSGQALTTDGSGTLSWVSRMTDPMSARGDIIVRDATNTTARLPIGAAGTVLKSVGAPADVTWATLTPTDVGLSNVTNDAQVKKSTGTAKGDLIAYTAASTPTNLPIGGTNGWVLQVDSSQATGMKWAANSVAANSLDFAQFSDAMTVDANTSINLNNKSLTINDTLGGGAGTLSMSTATGAALTLTAGATSTWSTSAGNLNLDSAAGLNLGTTNATSLSLGRAAATFALNSTGLNVNTTGDLTGVATIDTISTSATALTFAGAGTISASGANNLTLQGGSTNTVSLGTSTNLTAAGALTVDSNTTNALNFGNGANAKTITIGNNTGATAVNINAGTGSIKLAGQPTGTSATFLGLPVKTDSGDPTTTQINGAMYYNSNSNAFRCYENGAWKNCIGLSSSIITTKGDLLVYKGGATPGPTRLPVGGTNGQVLTVDSTDDNGMKWVAGLPAGTVNNSTLRYNSGTSTWQENTTFQVSVGALTGVSSIDTISTSSTALTFAAGGTLATTGANALAVDTGGAAGLNLGTVNTNAVAIGNAGSTLTITSSGGLNATTGGALTGVASIDTIGTTATALTFAGVGTISSTTSSALNLDSGTSGDVNLGTGGTAKNIKIGNATGATNVNVLAGSGNVTIGTSDATGTLLVLDTKTGAGDPSGTNGAMYYNSGTGVNKFRCYENGGWKDCDSAGAIGLQQAYNIGATITTAGGNAVTITTPIGSNNAGLVITQNNTTSNPVALQITNAGTGNDITATNWSVTKNGNISTSGNMTTTGSGFITSAGLLTGQLGLTVTGAAVSLNGGTSNFNTSINTGTSTGTVTIGNSASTAVKIGNLGTQYGIVYTSATDGTLAQTTAGTAGQFLQSNGTSAPTWASAFVPNIAQVYDAAGGTSITTSSIVIPFNTETVKDSNYTHSTGTNPSRVTFNNSGYYKISYNISSHDTTDSRENVQCRGRINGTTDIAPSKSYSYGRNTTDKDQTNTATFFYNATATQYLEIVCTLSGSNYTAITNAGESWATLEFIR